MTESALRQTKLRPESNVVLEVRGLSVSFGGLRAVDDISFAVERGEIFSIIGPNGAGKTTLFNLASGVYRAQSGAILLNGEDVTGQSVDALARRGLSRTFQNLQLFNRMTVLENVMTGRHQHERVSVFAQFFATPALKRQELATREHAMHCLARVGLEARAQDVAGALSYGAMKRLEIARALAMEPKILLLDEPAAGCNANETDEIDRLLAELTASGLAIALIEHDMKLVMGISNRILVLERGRHLLEGPPDVVARDARVIKAYLGEEAETAWGAADA